MIMAKEFMGGDFLLDSEPAKAMFEAAKDMPVFDWHCHLPPAEIYENREPQDIAQLWLGADHYKWRAMRSCGVEEKYITGDADGYEKFRAFAECMPSLIGNPMYHWCHLELRRYFGIYDILSGKTADSVWKKANEAVRAGGFKPRELIEKSNVTCLCTTDDPADSLEYHALLKNEKDFSCKVLPAFRPDKALGIDLPGLGVDEDRFGFFEDLFGQVIVEGLKIDDVLFLSKILFLDALPVEADALDFGKHGLEVAVEKVLPGDRAGVVLQGLKEHAVYEKIIEMALVRRADDDGNAPGDGLEVLDAP